jgi:hypothetical protein
MTTLREAALMALEALEYGHFAVADQAPHAGVMAYLEATDTLRTALEYQARQDEACDNLERYTQEMHTAMRSMPQLMGMVTDEDIANFSARLQAELNAHATQADTEELLRIGELPEPLRLAEMLEKTAQSPLHGKAADCLRQMYLKDELLQKAVDAEREACAELCLKTEPFYGQMFAEAIRARES